MAGHSKWANIQHRKGRQDEKRGKIFTRLIKEITVASRMGGSESGSNPRLRLAMDKAYENNMPKDTVERAIKRGAGELEGVSYEEIRYEGYGIGGAAIIVDCMTDNRVRTVAEVRHALRTDCDSVLSIVAATRASCSANSCRVRAASTLRCGASREDSSRPLSKREPASRLDGGSWGLLT